MTVIDELKRLLRRFPAIHRIAVSMHRSFYKGRMRQVWHWITRGHLVRRARVERFLSGEDPRALQVGGGYHAIREPGWLNGDLIAGDIYLDAGRRLPFPDASIDYVFTEQFFEHLPLETGVALLSEFHRVLRPGGVLRQGTPDLEGLIDVYYDRSKHVARDAAIDRHVVNHRPGDPPARSRPAVFLNDNFRRWGHSFIYDRDTLEQLSTSAGFVDVEWVEFGRSRHGLLDARERHADFEWMERAWVMIMECSKADGLGE